MVTSRKLWVYGIVGILTVADGLFRLRCYIDEFAEYLRQFEDFDGGA